MAKKTVATLLEGKTDGRSYTKVIKMVKSPKTGATFLTSVWFPMRLLRTSSRSNLNLNFNFHLLPSWQEM